MKYVIGITGGIATGKSTVSNYLIQLGYTLVDCDQLTRQSYTDCFDEINKAFPDCVVDGQISRPLLSKRVFTSNKDKETLEAIIHPYVRHKMLEVIQSRCDGIIFLDIPLLFEAHMEDLCDEVWVVYLNKQQQIERLMKRNQIDEETANMRIAAQMSMEEKRLKADIIFDNCGNIETLYKQVNQRMEELDALINQSR